MVFLLSTNLTLQEFSGACVDRGQSTSNNYNKSQGKSLEIKYFVAIEIRKVSRKSSKIQVSIGINYQNGYIQK